jgi:ribosomal protein S18 acetylase RimI-like enzyme
VTLDERRDAWRPILSSERPETFAWVAQDVGLRGGASRIVGIALAHLADDAGALERRDGVVHSIHVDPELHGQGIGRRLLLAALDDLRSAGCHEATLTVLSGNQPARAFYEHLGWSLDGPPFTESMSGVPALPSVEVVRYRLVL